MFEALNWAGVPEEGARQHNDPVLMAVRFVRDRVVHQWAEAVHGTNIPNPAATVVRPMGAGVGRSGVIAPPVVWEWFWKHSQALPQMHGRFAMLTRKRAEQAQYDAVFAGHPVRVALESSARHLLRAASSPPPHGTREGEPVEGAPHACSQATPSLSRSRPRLYDIARR